MHSYDAILPILEIHKKFKNSNNEKSIRKQKISLYSPFYRVNKIKAYSFFNSIKEKEIKNRELSTKNNQKKSNDIKYKFLPVNIYNRKPKQDLKSIIINQLLNKIKRKKNLEKNFNSSATGDYLSENNSTKICNSYKSLFNDSLKFKNEFIERKEKEKLYKKNIENKYNINLNCIKSYSRNNKQYKNILRKNPDYFDKYKFYIKYISNQKQNTLNTIDRNSCMNIINVSNNKNSDDVDTKKTNIINSQKNNNEKKIFNVNKYKHIKIKKIKLPRNN
jgi:hypothetical protein